MQRGDLKRDLPFLKLQLEEKKREWTRRGINDRTGCCATWGTCKLFSTSAEGVESRTRNPGMMLVKCFNELEVIFQYIFSWHQQTLHNGYYITALQQQILSFGLFVWFFFFFSHSLFLQVLLLSGGLINNCTFHQMRQANP